MFAPIMMALTIRYARKYRLLCKIVGNEKLIHTLPWITRISSSGSATDLNVSSSTRMTNTSVRMLMSVLSVLKASEKSLSLAVSPTK